MKRFLIGAAIVSVGGIGFLAGCAGTGLKHVNAEEFLRQARTMEQMNSASATLFIGTTPDRAYLERTDLYKLIPSHGARVFWTELEGLPQDIRDQLQERSMPWTPWLSNLCSHNVFIWKLFAG